MQKSFVASRYNGHAHGRNDPGVAAVNLLLVSRSAKWLQAVQHATARLGGGDVFTCDARDALARLAGTAQHYSHLLVDQNDAEGLLDELADLAKEVAAPDIDVLLLGTGDVSHPKFRTIPTAAAHCVIKALMANQPPRNGPAMKLAELRVALRDAKIDTRYQPIVRIADRLPVALEALARLNHPERGTIQPDRFIPQIEDAGLAVDLTRLVSARAFADLAGPLLAGRDLRMAVNFPLDVLLLPSALDQLEAQRTAAGLTADQVVIELTESRPADDFPALRRSLERLRGLGYGAAIDDVGPAVPRLALLLDLPFTSLKLDKNLVQQVDTTPAVREFLARTIDQAKAHQLVVVAEGVETTPIWERMRELGADCVQGFFAARPLPVAAVPIWWKAWMTQVTPPS